MYGTRSQWISQFYLHTPRTSANGINHTCLCLPSRSWYSFTSPRRNGRPSWPRVDGWLHTEISVRHRELNPDTIAHLSTNRTRRRLTSSKPTRYTNTPDHQRSRGLCSRLLENRFNLSFGCFYMKSVNPVCFR